jgi:DNA-binding transcriptional ArsR family regulator
MMARLARDQREGQRSSGWRRAIIAAMSDSADLERALAEGWAGQFVAGDGFASRAGESADAEVWALAFRAQRWFADPTKAELPTSGELALVEPKGAAALRAARIAGALAVEAAVLAFDLEAAAELDAICARFGDGGWSAVRRGLVALAIDEPAELERAANEVAKAGASSAEPVLVLRAASLRAFAAIARDDLDEATKLARRASRMARTEALPQEEYFANVALARVRRLTGRPHLAALILNALLKVASTPWREWLELERALTEMPSEGETTGTEAASAVRSLLHSAATGSPEALERAWARAIARVGGFRALRKDLDVLRGALLLDDSREVAAWAAGAIDPVPRGFDGLKPPRGESASVFASPTGERRRLLTLGVELARRRHEAEELPPAKARQARTETAIAALLLAGPEGEDETVFFRRIYGFEYDAAMHRGVRDVLYHRVRERLEDRAVFERPEGRVRLRVLAALLAPDPRCSPPPEHELLRMLAKLGALTAKDAAEALEVPLRTVQDALKKLVDEGACRVDKKGRQLEYRLEDTTFAEPTRR